MDRCPRQSSSQRFNYCRLLQITRACALLLVFGYPNPSHALLIGFHEVTTDTADAGTNVTVNVPTGSRVGDVMLAAVAVRNAVAVTAPAGWTLIRNDVTGTVLRTVLYYRVVTGTETATYAWTFASNRAVGAIVTYRGVDTSNPIDTSSGQGNASSANVTAPTLTTTVANAMLVGFFSVGRGTTETVPGTMDEWIDFNTSNNSNGATLNIADQQLAAAGATGTRIATAANNAVNIGQLVALRPAATVPAPVVWYRMDESAWTGVAGQVADSSSSNLDGTALGSATTTAGVKCRAGSFNGTTGRVDIAHDARMTMQSTFTVTGWIRPTSWPATGLMSFFSKDDNYEFHVAPGGQINWWWNDGTQELFSPNNTAPIGQWTFVAFVFTRGTQTLYGGNVATAVTMRVSGTDALQLNTNTLKMQIGDDQDTAGRRFNGLIDDMRVYSYALTQTEVDAVRTQVVPCAVDHYSLTHAIAGVNCQAENVTVTAHDASHIAVTLNNATTITVTAQFVAGAGAGNRGDWALITGGGTLANGTGDDGVATYIFAAGGESSVVLALKDTWAQTVNVSVTDGLVTDTSGTASADAGYNQNLSFAAAGFRFIDASNNAIPNQIAGVISGSMSLQAIQSTTCGATGACTGVCMVPSAFGSGALASVSLAFECVNPISCQASQQVSITNSGTSAIAANNLGSVTAYTAKSLLFGANGQAAFTLNYPDVGAIRLYARYNIPLGTGGASSTNMVGSSNSFVVKPYSFVLSNIRRTSDSFANPGASNASGTAFIRAGDPFTATVTAVNLAGSATPNYGKETTPEGARLISALTGGLGLTANPAIAGSLGTFTSGVASGTAFSWGEVGIVTLSAGVADSDYLGAGDASVFTQTGNVGRFTTHHLSLSGAALTNRVLAGCAPVSGFTYMGEGIGVQYTLSALNAAGAVTQNYATANSFSKMPTTPGTASPISTLGYGAVNLVTNLTSRLDLSVVNAITWSVGQATVTANVGLSRAAAPDGPYSALRIGIAPSDQDGIGMLAASFDMDVDGIGGNDHDLIGSTEARFGRLRIFNGASSQLIDLPCHWNCSTTTGWAS